MLEPRPTYLRFVLQRDNADSGVREGPFGTAYALRDSSSTPAYHRERLAEIIIWFKENLKRPSRFNRTKSKGYYRRSTKGISWFKSGASGHVSRMRELVAILEDHGHVIDQIVTRRPGYIVYEDDFQIVAEPFADDKRNQSG